MEAEERPAKVRKLSHDEAIPISDPNAEGQPSSFSATKDHEANANDDNPNSTPTTTHAQASTPGLPTSSQPLSKNQQKKLARKLEWESLRPLRAAQRKTKTALKKSRQRAARDAHLAASGLTLADYARQRSELRPRPTQVPVTFVLDCGYDELMRDGERISLAAQITRAYGENRRGVWRGHVCISSFGGLLSERFEGVLGGAYVRWNGFRVFEEGFKDVADKAEGWMRADGGGELVGPFEGVDAQQGGEVVYLSSEGEEVLEELKPYSTYIVGGLVDKNREKGVCHRAAVKAGVRTARLPIGEYLEMQSRKVLATNHVIEIMLKWLEYRDWGKAFLEVIPKRKGGALKGKKDENDSKEGEDDQEESDEDDNAALESADLEQSASDTEEASGVERGETAAETKDDPA